MIGLLTWPAYGTWFARQGRGWVDRDRERRPGEVPEPRRRGRGRPKWPPARLDRAAQAVLVEDVQRVAALRGFEPLVIVAAPDHVHLLLDLADDRDVPRLVQLVKGALSRALTVAAGDEPAASTRGGGLPHHKWWTRQYSFTRVDATELDLIRRRLLAHQSAATTVWSPYDP